MLQVDYERATKDGDVLETNSVTAAVKSQLISLAGKDTEIQKRRGRYTSRASRAGARDGLTDPK